MMYKRLLAILGTVIFAMNTVPAIPAAAADSTPPAALSEQQEEAEKLFTPGFDWERYGAVTIDIGNEKENAEGGYRGLHGILSEPDADFYLIWDWDGERPKPADKPLGKVTAEKCEYEIYRCEAGKSLLHPDNKRVEYWSVPVDNSQRAGRNIFFWLNTHFEDWTNCGLPVGRLESFAYFTAEKQENGGYLTEDQADAEIGGTFECGHPEQQPGRWKLGDMPDDFNWEIYQVPEAGRIWASHDAVNGLTATWEEISAGGRTLFSCSKSMDIRDITQRRDFLHYDYSAKAVFTGNASIGVIAFLTDQNTEPAKQTEVHIIDAWGETRPESETKCGEIAIEGSTYDVYRTEINTMIGGKFEMVKRTQFLVVRKENQMPKNADETYSASHNVTDILCDLVKFGMETTRLQNAGLIAEIGNGSGSVTFTKNAQIQNEAENCPTAMPDSSTQDGYYWLPMHNGTEKASEFAYQKDGKYTVSWKNAYEVGCECGLNHVTPLHSDTPEYYQYAADVDAAGSVAVGVRFLFRDPYVTAFIVDGMKGEMLPNLQKIGAEKIGDTTYDVWKFVPAVPDQVPPGGGDYWFVSRENQLNQADAGTVRNTIKLADVMQALKNLGHSLENPERLGSAFCAYNHSTGSIAFTENRLTDKAEITQPDTGHGDIDGDGTVSVEDAQTALIAYVNSIIGLESGLTEQQMRAADVNGDGQVSAEDAQFILIYYARVTLAGEAVTWEDVLMKS